MNRLGDLLGMDFVRLADELGNWNISLIIDDVQELLQSNGYDWMKWKQEAIIKNNAICEYDCVDLNLTSNFRLCTTLHDRLLKYSGRRFAEDANIDDGHLYQMLPELDYTYTGSLIKHVQKKLGPVRVRLHNRINRIGLYWHIDKHATTRYHLALWTHPGAFVVWTNTELQWNPTYDPIQCKSPFDIHAKFIPSDGNIYALQTGQFIHGVCNIGVGWKEPAKFQSRCHLTFWPITPVD